MPVPSNLEAILSTAIPDPAGDQEIGYGGSPPVVVPHSPADLTGVRLGVSGNRLHLRFTFAGTIPSGPVAIAAQSGMPAQTVRHQQTNFALDLLDPAMAGLQGDARIGVLRMNILFGYLDTYGQGASVFALYDWATADERSYRGNLVGSRIEGGPGTDHVTLAFDVSGLGQFFPRGRTVRAAVWSEATSHAASGSVLYDHFSFDATGGVSWTIPN